MTNIARQALRACFIVMPFVWMAAAWAANSDPAAPPEPTARIPQIDMGIAQLPNEKLDWLQDGKFGMFIHWGLYAGPGKGEWYMENAGNLHVKKAYDVYTNAPLVFGGDREILISGINRTESPADSVIAILYEDEIQSVWKK